MPSRRHRIACLLAAAVLASPGAAWGQSAGDEQYEDPFAPEPGQEQPDDSGGSGGGGTTGGSDDGESAPQPQPAPAPEPAPVTSTQTAQPPSDAAQLPRTGAPTGLIAAGGALLLVGGVVLRVRFSERGLRRRTSWRADRA